MLKTKTNLQNPNERILDKSLIDGSYARLMIANDGLDVENLPQALQGIISSAKHPVLSHVALLSQFDEMMVRQIPNTTLTPAPSLPVLSKPTLPDHLHRLTRQILTENHQFLHLVVRLLMMIDERGYSVPPTVWLPPKSMSTKFDGSQTDYHNFEGELPQEYLAWCAWVNGERDDATDEILTEENWHEHYPSSRIRLLEHMRRADPKSVLDLLTKFMPKESADKRLDLLSVLAVGLCEDDKVFLQNLLKDRSQKVKDQAKLFLAKLGEYEEHDPVADELFEELEFGADGIVFKDIRSQKRRESRYNQLQMVNLHALAKKFELSLKNFVLAWDFVGNGRKMEDYDYNYPLMVRVCALLSDDELLQLGEFFINKMMSKQLDLYYWQYLRPKLPLAIRQEFAKKMFLKGKGFDELIEMTPDKLDMGFRALRLSSSYKSLIQEVTQYQENPNQHTIVGELDRQLHALGLMVSQDVAKACLADLYTLGVDKTESALQTLMLNALLDPSDPLS